MTNFLRQRRERERKRERERENEICFRKGREIREIEYKGNLVRKKHKMLKKIVSENRSLRVYRVNENFRIYFDQLEKIL